MTREQKMCWVVLGIGGLSAILSKPVSILYNVGVIMMAGVTGYAFKGLIDELHFND